MSEHDLEAPDADAAEQDTPVVDDPDADEPDGVDELGEDLDVEVDPADRAEQRRSVAVDDDEYR